MLNDSICLSNKYQIFVSKLYDNVEVSINKKYINTDDLISYENNIKMYSLDKYSHKINYNTKRNHELLQSILEKDNFLFVK